MNGTNLALLDLDQVQKKVPFFNLHLYNWYHKALRSVRPGRGNGTMLIKLQDFDDQLAEELKTHFNQKTASGAVRKACIDWPILNIRYEHMLGQCYDLAAEVKRLQAIIENARSSAAALLDKTSQGDLLAEVSE